MEQGTFFVAGHSTLSVPSLEIKYLNDKSLRMWPNGDGEIDLITPGEAARFELIREFPDIKRVGWRGPMIKLFDKRVPMFYLGPATSSEMVYIDLKSAYWQIYRMLWLDVLYPRGLYGRYPMAGVADRLERWKAARNAVIGLIRSRDLVGFKGHKRIKMTTKNKFLSPCLWATVIDILHWIAEKAISEGAIYINTDGYLFHDQARADRFMLWLIERGLIFSVRDWGPGEVRGWNSYKVNKTQTQVYKLNLPYYDKEFTNVRPQPARKWQRYYHQISRIVRVGSNEYREDGH